MYGLQSIRRRHQCRQRDRQPHQGPREAHVHTERASPRSAPSAGCSASHGYRNPRSSFRARMMSAPKLKVAFMTGRHDTVGQCLVNSTVSMTSSCRAPSPLFFLDYLATRPPLARDRGAGGGGGFDGLSRERVRPHRGETAESPLLRGRRVRHGRVHRGSRARTTAGHRRGPAPRRSRCSSCVRPASTPTATRSRAPSSSSHAGLSPDTVVDELGCTIGARKLLRVTARTCRS